MNTTDKLTELPINFVLIPIETKFIPIETKVVRTKKKFSEKSLSSRLLDKPTDKRTFEQNHLRLI